MFRLALASSRFASPPFFRSRFVPKVNFSIERIRVYTYPGEKSEFIPPIFPPILILPSLPSSSIFFIYTPTDANRHTLLYPTLLVKTIRPLVNLPPRFSSHIRLTTGKKRGEGGRGGEGEEERQESSIFRPISCNVQTRFERVRIDLVPISCIFSTPDIDRKLDARLSIS